ncbi:MULTISPECIES: tRNA pseudouridine(13) synthase TruD [Halomonas]|uniref:tRNA pseudouridine synthase D n=2 Tax=Halomonas TaxID=2745 RepID=A0AAU7KKK8_9GAMM|nr:MULTISPECIES: tRNA pseudouridine(13) synthase TruD [Halomonas]MBR9769943.1 tRNA pseudouridine(13) synthase TruD [Gammaproteobacteria bacterium]MAR73900.1 tRNA pseudouridine(13) synthase TruD [Halomonas sp.]MAY73076.1 tRNA pseudouridine(13) synthase TruD [Halomonas sp.]MBR9878396.1 tRNA pseudouridine(13) synthase TruD [Gammaproteobacteria bacterium]MBY5939743.1 tRNA pseudouridine(13) synthase TruD [Halomonas sp. DP5N14-9]|tara:strand:+ start:1191 stop:2366 length:1176 start_codon:yes stop_codon:yes gene_type:complete
MSDAIVWPPDWPRYLDERFGAPMAGRYRETPEDFQVEEDLGFAPEGQGEHLWLWIAKRDTTTARVASTLAHQCQVSRRDVGYAGMKDRTAVTRQWFSVHLAGREAPKDLDARLAAEGYVVEAASRHPRKLKRGVHRGNRFRLKLTGEVARDPGLEQRFEALVSDGVPNYFGPQRFGHEGRNLSKACAVLERGWRKRDDREGMLLSAARSYLFNAQLAERLRRGCWREVLAGDVMMLEGTHSLFDVESPDDALKARLEQGDIHPAGVLWGTGGSRARERAEALEQDVLAEAPALCAGLEKARVKASRRALRVMPTEARLWRQGDAVWLEFRLPAGAFATAVLRELMDHPTLSFRNAPSVDEPLVKEPVARQPGEELTGDAQPVAEQHQGDTP